MSENSKKTLMEEFNDLSGMPLWLYALCAVIILAVAFTGALGKELVSFVAVGCTLAVIFNKIGKVIGFWDKYIGGGLLMVFFGCAVIKQYNLLPKECFDFCIDMVSGKVNILNLYIVALITGSILGLNRSVLLKSFAGYIPAILGGLIGAAALGIACGLCFGIAPAEMVIKYVLPIMGGGNGAGAVPLSKIYEQITGEAAGSYYSFAIIILTIANLMCILAGALLNRLGEKCPSLTGDRESLMPLDSDLVKEDTKVKISMSDYCGGLLLIGTVYAVGRLFSKILLPTILGAPIHNFAYSIIFVVIISALGIVPEKVKAAAKSVQVINVSVVSLLIMVGLGFDFDLGEFAAACSLVNVLIAAVIVIGAIIGSALVGKLVGFYPIDSAVTAGLCMANRGGNGDIAVLTAAKRMGLISYAQLSSRVGGGIVLIIASFVFSAFLTGK